MSDQAVSALLARLEQVTARLEKLEAGNGGAAAPAAASAGSGGSSAAASAFDNVVASFSAAADAAAKIGDAALTQQVEAFKAALAHERELINIASQSKKPSNVQPFLAPTSAAMATVGEVREKNRSSKNPNHLTALSEAANALGWVAVAPTPGPFIDDARQSTEFYTNRILKEFKGKDDNHVAFAQGTIQFLKDMRQYVKDHHTTELAWNPRGGDAKAPTGAAAAKPAAAAAAPAAAAPPPPPASLAADIASASSSSSKADPPARGNLFADINKGNVTSGLKHVDKSQMTHKNPGLRAGSTVPTDGPKKPAAGAASKTAAPAKVMPPKLELQGNKWVVEYFKNDQSIVISDTEPRQVIYIYKCEGSVIQIKGKINAITVDSCKKTGVVFEEAIATCEVVNCTSLQVQVTNTVPSLAIDNTAGCQVFLNAEKLSNTEIVSSKSCEMNVAYTDLKTQELVEMPLPEQYKTTLTSEGKASTVAVEHV